MQSINYLNMIKASYPDQSTTAATEHADSKANAGPKVSVAIAHTAVKLRHDADQLSDSSGCITEH
jgi:hypothetical protein